ncbi:MAG: ribonuclease R, partial [Planctomycetes bacterium]|nr:ribonuclease R [Planctomycetota bacterium]
RPGYRPVAAEVLARELNITKKRMREFRALVGALLADGKIRQTARGELRGNLETNLVEGTIKKTLSGAGYLIPRRVAGGPEPADPRAADVFIAAHDLKDAHTGDQVLVQLQHRDGGRLRGRVVEIVQRSTRTFVGTYGVEDGQGYVRVDGTTLNEPVFVGDPGAKGARPGDKVVFEMVRFPSHAVAGEGVLTQVLGPRGRPGVDTLSIIHEFGLPDEFPEEVLETARDAAERFNENDLGDRRDLTAETIVTIDPVDARDFDDAISLTRSDDGHWHLGVHIADVAHFVQPGTALDHEAYRRGTSVYLPDRVLPMLPELISNGLASLQQGRVRYTKSAFLEYSAEGVLLHSEFANTAIKVTKRFAYEEVMPIVREPERFKTRVSAKVRKLLAEMYELSMLLRRRRFEHGALELTMPEVKIDFDEKGRVSGAHVTPHDPSHQIIEEFMLAANMAVATEFDDHGIPFLRRTHPDPDEAKLRTFGKFVTSLGYTLKKYQSREDLQRLLNKVQGSTHTFSINYAFLRSLKQASYSPEALGHFALAADNYCHFTSPIRRYPDLTIHRLLDAHIRKDRETPIPGISELLVKGEHCSRTERRAEQAERELVKVKLLTYMSTRLGDEFDAIITGVQDWGFFCQGEQIPAEGLVHVSTLDDDYYTYEMSHHLLEGRRTGRQYRLGGRVRVVVAHVDVDRRQLDLRLVGSRAAASLKRRLAEQPRRPVAGGESTGSSGGKSGSRPHPKSGERRDKPAGGGAKHAGGKHRGQKPGPGKPPGRGPGPGKRRRRK